MVELMRMAGAPPASGNSPGDRIEKVMAEPELAPVVGKKLNGREKAAALLLAMGKPFASRVLKYFEEDEIKAVAESAAKLGVVPRPVLNHVIQEFTQKFSGGTDLHSTLNEVEALLKGVVSPERLAEILQDLRGVDKRAVWPRLSVMQEIPVANHLMKEHPQVAAFVISKASPAAAAAVLEVMPSELRSELMRRMLTMKHVFDLPVSLLEDSLHDELLHKGGAGGGENIHAKIADVINRMSRDHMDEVFEALNQFRPKEAEKVKALLFTFDDIIKLRPEAVAKLFDQVAPEQVVLALIGADAQLSERILAALGSRSRRIIEQELKSANPSPKDVHKARRAIADFALKLSEKGEIDIHGDEE
jgi:flagellar motor switch protein FliG